MLLRLLIPVLILALGALAAWRMGIPVETPKPQPVPPQVLKTEVLELQRSDFAVLLDSQGSVRAHYTTTITPHHATPPPSPPASLHARSPWRGPCAARQSVGQPRLFAFL